MLSSQNEQLLLGFFLISILFLASLHLVILAFAIHTIKRVREVVRAGDNVLVLSESILTGVRKFALTNRLDKDEVDDVREIIRNKKAQEARDQAIIDKATVYRNDF